MYKVIIDGKTLFFPGDTRAVLTDPEVKLQTGYAGEFNFKVPIANPLYNEIKNRKSMVSVYRDKKEIFYGEVRNYKKDRFKNKKVFCAGAMSFLADSIQPQVEYHDMGPRALLEKWLEIHNEQVEDRKKIYCGIVTIHDENDSLYRITNMENTLKAIREKLVDKLGGHLRLRHQNGKLYLDWIEIAEYGKHCEQPIEFSMNMLDYSETLSADDVITHLIPLGAKLEEEADSGEKKLWETYVDITSVNNGSNYIYSQEAADNFGHVWATKKWDDVNMPSNLLRKGKEFLETGQFETLVLRLTAVDLSLMDKTYDIFEIGDCIRCKAKQYGMDKVFPVMEMTIPLQRPENATLQLGESKRSGITDTIKSGLTDMKKEAEENGYIMTEWLKSAIDNATQMLTGSKGGYRLDEYDENGLFLRTLYMDAPRKEDAVNILQIGPMGIGFSRTGYAGPYLSAWTIDGVLLGEYIKAHSIKAEALETEYIESVEKQIEDAETGAKEWANDKITTQIKAVQSQITLSVETERIRASGVEDKLSSRITVNQNSISSEVSRATGAENVLSSKISQTENSISSEVIRAKNAESTLSSQIKQTADSITLCVKNEDYTGNNIISKINMTSTTATIAASKVNINADDIRLKATKLTWSSTYSSMSADGKLTCSGITIKDGTFVAKNGTSNIARLKSGKLEFGYGSSYGSYIESANYGSAANGLELYAKHTILLHAGREILLQSPTVVNDLTAYKLKVDGAVTQTLNLMASDGNSYYTLRFKGGILMG